MKPWLRNTIKIKRAVPDQDLVQNSEKAERSNVIRSWWYILVLARLLIAGVEIE